MIGLIVIEGLKERIWKEFWRIWKYKLKMPGCSIFKKHQYVMNKSNFVTFSCSVIVQCYQGESVVNFYDDFQVLSQFSWKPFLYC